MPTEYDRPLYVDPRIFVCPTIANLRLCQGAVPAPTAAASGGNPSYAIAILLGATAAFDTTTDGIYAWDETSTTADNGTTVIRPTAVAASAAGRWRSIV